jgi:serine/threonine-protein kinase
MTPERWRAVDAVLQAALACPPDRRDACVAEGCGRGTRPCAARSRRCSPRTTRGRRLPRAPAVEALGALPPSHTAQLAAGLAGRYVIQGELARGGMATVYRAHDLRHGRAVALKVLRDEVAAAVGAERFLEEIRVTASLQHPHILPLFDSGRADGLLWYAMPLVEGDTLRARIAREGPLPIDDAVRIAREVAEALDYAHARGVVHRDVKPENVLLQGGHALVADFGIALALEHAGGERLTRTGLTLGTPHYMAPEQAAGRARARRPGGRLRARGDAARDAGRRAAVRRIAAGRAARRAARAAARARRAPPRRAAGRRRRRPAGAREAARGTVARRHRLRRRARPAQRRGLGRSG